MENLQSTLQGLPFDSSNDIRRGQAIHARFCVLCFMFVICRVSFHFPGNMEMEVSLYCVFCGVVAWMCWAWLSRISECEPRPVTSEWENSQGGDRTCSWSRDNVTLTFHSCMRLLFIQVWRVRLDPLLATIYLSF